MPDKKVNMDVPLGTKNLSIILKEKATRRHLVVTEKKSAENRLSGETDPGQ